MLYPHIPVLLGRMHLPSQLLTDFLLNRTKHQPAPKPHLNASPSLLPSPGRKKQSSSPAPAEWLCPHRALSWPHPFPHLPALKRKVSFWIQFNTPKPEQAHIPADLRGSICTEYPSTIFRKQCWAGQAFVLMSLSKLQFHVSIILPSLLPCSSFPCCKGQPPQQQEVPFQTAVYRYIPPLWRRRRDKALV